MRPALVPILLGANYSAEARLLFAAMTTPASATRKALIDTTIKSLKTAGVWTLLDFLYVPAAADSQAARLNWKNPGTLTLSPQNAPTFVADRGYSGDGAASYLSTGYDPSASSLGMAQDDAHIGVFTTTDSVNTGHDIGAASNRARIRNRDGGASATNGRISVAGDLNYVGTAPAAPRHVVMIRRDAGTQLLFANGTQNATQGDASSGISGALWLCASGAPSSFSDRRQSVAHVGRALSDAQALAAYNAFLTYLQSVGAA